MLKLNLGSGKVRREGFVSVDKFAMPEVDRQLDLFTFPWDFENDSVDEYFMSHIIEHIPHEPKRAEIPRRYYNEPLSLEEVENKVSWWVKRWDKLKDYDGFFCWFAEVWRIGVNGAKIHIVSPYGFSYGSFQDPTHTRYIVPPTFSYLTAQAQESINWDYHLPFLYKVTQATVSIPDTIMKEYQEKYTPKDLDNAMTQKWNIGYDLIAELEIIKCEVCNQPHETKDHQ